MEFAKLYFNLIPVFAFIAVTIIGVVVYLNNRKDKVTRLWFLTCLSAALWSGFLFLTNNAQTKDLGLLLRIFMDSFGILVVFFWLRFVVAFLGVERRLLTELVTICTVLMLIFNTTPWLVKDLVPKYGFNYYVEANFGYFIFTVYFSAVVVLGLILIAKEKQRASGVRLYQVKNIFIGSIVGFVGGGSTFLYSLGVPLPPYLLFLFAGFPLIIGRGIVRYNLFNIKVIAAELLAFTIWGVLLFDLFSKTTLSGYVESGIVLVFTIIAGIFLIKSVKKEVSQREHIEKLAENLGAANESLSVANEKLKGLDKLKSEFLSLASHQLRSPLTAIKGYTSMLVEGSYGKLEEKQKEVIGNVLVSTQSLISMVEDFLNVSKIEQGGMQYVFEPTQLAKLVSNLFAEMKITAQNNGLDFTLTMDPGDAFTINADAGKLRQVFLNLVDNSIKYTPSGFVHLSLARNKNKNTVTFSVEDTGAGISAEEKEKLFEKFKRGDGQKINTGGSGLGLYLAREIVKAHNGRILVESEGKGKGSCFVVELGAGDNAPSI